MVAGLGVLVFVCAYLGARLTLASIETAAERQAKAIRRFQADHAARRFRITLVMKRLDAPSPER